MILCSYHFISAESLGVDIKGNRTPPPQFWSNYKSRWSTNWAKCALSVGGRLSILIDRSRLWSRVRFPFGTIFLSNFVWRISSLEPFWHFRFADQIYMPGDLKMSNVRAQRKWICATITSSPRNCWVSMLKGIGPRHHSFDRTISIDNLPSENLS